MERRGSISDDWEELSDSFSVVSVPTSVHGDDKPLLGREDRVPDADVPPGTADLPLRPVRSHASSPPVEAAPPIEPVVIPHQREAAVSERSLAADVSDGPRDAPSIKHVTQSKEKQETGSNTADTHVDEEASVEQQVVDRGATRPGPACGASDDSSDSGVDEILDSHIDPAFFLGVLKSLEGMIDETLVLAGAVTLYRTATTIEEVCGSLSHQIKELTPIISGYARSWNSSSQDIPLDPGLQAWMSGVRINLLGLQTELQHQDAQAESGCNSTRSFETSCQKYCDALSEHEKQMDMFLPIMQVDYNEFETNQMNFPTQRARDLAAPNTHVSPINIRSTPARPPPVRPSSDSWQLRQALYELRDRLQDSVEKLSHCASILTPSAAALCRDVVQSYGVLFNNLSLILSNHGSDWIEHGLRGGLTYAQFMDIDVGVIRDFTAQLSQALDTLRDGARSPLAYWEQRYGAEPCRPSVLLDEGLLASFETLAEVLTATLIPAQA